MKVLLVLLAHSLKRVRAIVASVGVLLFAFQLILILVAASIERSNAFGQISALIPPYVRDLLGPSFAGFMSFSGIVCLGYFHVAVMGSLVAMAIALGTMPASEIETGFMDLILSRPVARHWIVTRTICVLMLSTVVLLAMMMAGTWSGLRAFAPATSIWPEPKLVVSLAVNLGLLMLCWGGIAAAIGAAARRRSVAGGLAGWLALAAFLLDYVARVWEPADSLGRLSPFRYYSPFEMLMGKPLSDSHVLVLAGIATASLALAYLLFARRDISH